MTLGSPNPDRRQFFVNHMKSGLVAMLEFFDKLPDALNGQQLFQNVWLSGCSKRPFRGQVWVLQRVREALIEVFSEVDWKGKIDVAQEGKAPPTQQSLVMEVDNIFASHLARELGHRWCLDIGHGFPTQPFFPMLGTARTFDIPLAMHITHDMSGADDDLTLALYSGQGREFLRQAAKLESMDSFEEADVFGGADGMLLPKRKDLLRQIPIGVDTFEQVWPPELAMLQGIMVTRMMIILAFCERPDAEFLAGQSGNQIDGALEMMSRDQLSVNAANCLEWWRLENGLDPNWTELGVDALRTRVND